METLSPRDLAAQALVLFVDGGKSAAELMDSMEEEDRKYADPEIEDSPYVGSVPDNAAMPEGMNLREFSMGVIPRA